MMRREIFPELTELSQEDLDGILNLEESDFGSKYYYQF